MWDKLSRCGRIDLFCYGNARWVAPFMQGTLVEKCVERVPRAQIEFVMVSTSDEAKSGS